MTVLLCSPLKPVKTVDEGLLSFMMFLPACLESSTGLFQLCNLHISNVILHVVESAMRKHAYS